MKYRFGVGFLCVLVISSVCVAVTSSVTRQSSSVDFLKGKVSDVIVSSQGTVELGRSAQELVEEFGDVWSINSIVNSGGTVYIGTSPNGDVYKYSLGKFTRIYPADLEVGPVQNPVEPNDVNEVKAEQHLTNEHIFAMATDVSGRLLVAVSGKVCTLMRYESGQMETVVEFDEDTKYVFAITSDQAGNVYLGTGPEGKIFRLKSFDSDAELIYDSQDKNILSLAAGVDGYLYAGSDSRGLVYKIDPREKTATVLYDSEQPEVTALLFGKDGQLYAAATSAKIVAAQNKFASQLPSAGKPEKVSETEGQPKVQGGVRLKIPNMSEKASGDKVAAPRPPSRKGPAPGKASFVYKITPEGYVTDVFSEAAVFFNLTGYNSDILIGSGNSGRLYSIDPATERQAVIYEDQYAAQITAVAVAASDVYLGTANPAKLMKLGSRFAFEGTYTSDLIDAVQPARWGKLQIDADIPAGSKVMVSSRAGNVKDVNDPTFSQWTDPIEVKEPIQLRCPVGRFCQYKLQLKSPEGLTTPVVREVAVAHSAPNLAPKVESVSVARIKAAGKTGVFTVAYNGTDANKDKLIYKIDFRKVGRTAWIELKDENETESYEWDGKTVEDGHYEIRVTASDVRDNTSETKLTAGRVSDPVVVDNTVPFVKKAALRKETREGKTVVVIKLIARDDLSAIGKLHYTIDSNAEWKGTVPDDLVYDTNEEDFTVTIHGLKPGEHIITVRISDDVGNTMYRTFEVTI